MGGSALRILLDTHIWLWRLLEPKRLPGHLGPMLSDPENELYLSPISVWETLFLARRGRVELRPSAQAWTRDALLLSRPRLAALTHEVALRSEDLPGFGSDDPADRFLVATALANRLTLATSDRAMLDYQPLETVR